MFLNDKVNFTPAGSTEIKEGRITGMFLEKQPTDGTEVIKVDVEYLTSGTFNVNDVQPIQQNSQAITP
jgi:hypothetical protein